MLILLWSLENLDPHSRGRYRTKVPGHRFATRYYCPNDHGGVDVRCAELHGELRPWLELLIGLDEHPRLRQVDDKPTKDLVPKINIDGQAPLESLVSPLLHCRTPYAITDCHHRTQANRRRIL